MNANVIMTSRTPKTHNPHLEQILDDALDAFDDVDDTEAQQDEAEEAPSLPTSSRPSPADNLTLSSDSREENAPPPSIEDAAGRAFEDALRALDQLRTHDTEASSSADADLAEADMKLVEQFVTTLGESLSGLGTDPGNDNLPPRAGLNDEKGELPIVERLVESIVGHLLSADVLKQPMRQMRVAYAQWLPKQTSLTDDQRRKYERQQQLIHDICQKYERGASTTEIMQSLADMQETGEIPDGVMSQLDTDGALETVMDRIGSLDLRK